MPQVRLGELLLRGGVIGADQLRSALAAQARSGLRLGRVLIDQHAVEENELRDALSRLTGLPKLELSVVPIEPRAGQWLGTSWAERFGLVAISLDGARRVLSLAITDPTDVGPLDELAFKTGLRILPQIAKESELDRLLAHLYRAAPLERLASSLPPQPSPAEPEILHDMNELRDDLQGFAPQLSPPLANPIAPLIDAQQSAARELQVLFELCLEAGLIRRQEYLERLAALDDQQS